jgi:hypothetical protein
MLLQDLLNNYPKTTQSIYTDIEKSIEKVHGLTVHINEKKKFKEDTIRSKEIKEEFKLKVEPGIYFKENFNQLQYILKKNLIQCKLYLLENLLILIYKGINLLKL